MFPITQIQGETVYPGSDMEKDMRGTRMGIYQDYLIFNFESKLIQSQDRLSDPWGS